MSTAKKNLNHLLIAQFSGQQSQITIPKLYYRLTQCLNKAYLLNQIVFYSDKSTYCKDGWFYKSYEEWQEELFLTDRTLRTYFKDFEKSEFIEMRIAKVQGKRTPFFRPKMDMITKAIANLLSTELSEPEPQKPEDDQNLPQTEKSSELDKDCPKRKNLPDSQTEKFSVSNTIYTDEKDHMSVGGSNSPSHTNDSLKPKTKKELAELSALNAPEIQEFFDTKFAGFDVTLEQLFADCQEYYAQKSLWATRKTFLKWVKTEKIENYKKAKSTKVNNETDEQRQERQFFEWELLKERDQDGYVSKPLQQYPEMRVKYA
jgi:hypothetical protein